MKRSTIMLVLAFFVCAVNVFAQARTISGTVVSAGDKSPVIGATVIVEGTTNGSVTGVNGEFSITGVDGATNLDVRYVGFTSQLVAVSATQTTVNIELQEDAIKADEVVVTGLGISREKKALGYAVQDLGTEDLIAAGNSNIITSLQGKVSGVEIKPSSGMPGASSQIVIRGARSFTGNNQPLYVIDGMPISSASDMSTGSSVTGADFSNRALDIDPNDIESMDILKGQAASALYGIRASNGVVVITTKSGKKNGNGRVNVSFSNTTSFDKVSRLPDMQTTYAQGAGGQFNPNSSMSWGPKISDLPNDPVYGGNSQGHPGKYYVLQLEDTDLDPWQTPEAYNNVKGFYQTGFSTNTAASVSQNKDGYNYYLGVNNTKQEGIIENTGMDRSGIRMNASTKLAKSWNTGFSGSFNQTKIDKAPSANDGVLATVYGAPASYNLNGYPYSPNSDAYAQLNYRPANPFNNPHWAMEHNTYSEKTSRFYGNAYVEFAPDYDWSHNQSISVKYQGGVDSYNSIYDTITEYGSTGTDGSIDNTMYSNSTFNSLLTATYKIDFTEDLKLDVLLGNEINHTSQRSVWAGGQNFNFGGWAHIDNATTQWGGDARSQERSVGFFANVNLAYKNMLYLGVTGRQDITSIMPRNNRSFFYPSVSLGYVFSEHEALQNSNVLNYGKIRASYAEVGQAARYYNNYYSMPSYGGGFWNFAPIVYPNDGVTTYLPSASLYDENLKPQNTKSVEAGFDLRMFNNVLELSYTYSRQNVKDQIFDVPLAASTGYASRTMNGGRIHTNTHEILATVNIINKKDWSWSVNANFTKMDNFVDELAEGVESIFLGGFVTPQVRAGIGDKFPVIYGNTFARDKKTGNILVDEYGLPYAGAPDVIGSASPNFNLGFGTALRWKDIQLAATFDWKNGGQMYSGSNNTMDLYGTTKVTENREKPIVFDGYKANGEKNDIACDAYDLYVNALGNIDEAAIYDADFVKLRELSISYKIKAYKSFVIGVNAFARNILIWAPIENLDPESTQGNTNMGGSFERFSLPQTTSYGFGVNLSF